jgi:hypothetical protein
MQEQAGCKPMRTNSLGPSSQTLMHVNGQGAKEYPCDQVG